MEIQRNSAVAAVAKKQEIKMCENLFSKMLLVLSDCGWHINQ